MSIYATLWNIKVEDNSKGGAFDDAWVEVWAQGVPNHINEQNGYGGPGWDEWMPAFQHEPDCRPRVQTLQNLSGTASPWTECGCGMRAVFICDDLTKKATPRNGQEYVNPVLVLTGAEYHAMTFVDLLDRIEEAVADRGRRPVCQDDECDSFATTVTMYRGTIVKAWCDDHSTEALAGAGAREGEGL